MAQTKHETEAQAREAARKLGGEQCQIVQSKEAGPRMPGPWVFYLESGDETSMVRSWERRAYDGPGKDA